MKREDPKVGLSNTVQCGDAILTLEEGVDHDGIHALVRISVAGDLPFCQKSLKKILTSICGSVSLRAEGASLILSRNGGCRNDRDLVLKAKQFLERLSKNPLPNAKPVENFGRRYMLAGIDPEEARRQRNQFRKRLREGRT